MKKFLMITLVAAGLGALAFFVNKKRSAAQHSSDEVTSTPKPASVAAAH